MGLTVFTYKCGAHNLVLPNRVGCPECARDARAKLHAKNIAHKPQYLVAAELKFNPCAMIPVETNTAPAAPAPVKKRITDKYIRRVAHELLLYIHTSSAALYEDQCKIEMHLDRHAQPVSDEFCARHYEPLVDRALLKRSVKVPDASVRMVIAKLVSNYKKGLRRLAGEYEDIDYVPSYTSRAW